MNESDICGLYRYCYLKNVYVIKAENKKDCI